MGDLKLDSRLAGDAYRFVERLEELVALVPDMSRIDASAPGHNPAEGDELVGPGEASGRVFEPAREPEGAGGQGFGDERLHLRLFLGPRSPVLEPHSRSADRAVPDERPIIQPQASLLEAGEERREVPPAELEAVLSAEKVCPLLEFGGGDGDRGRAALAADQDGHALTGGAVGRRVDEKLGIGVVMDVDEPGRDGPAPDVENGPASAGQDSSDLLDPGTDEADIGFQGRAAEAVVNEPALEDEVEVLSRGAAPQDEPRSRGQAGRFKKLAS